MIRGPENPFGKAPGRFEEMMARRLVQSLPAQALASCAAMDDELFAEFIRIFNALFDRGARRARIELLMESTPIAGFAGSVDRRLDAAARQLQALTYEVPVDLNTPLDPHILVEARSILAAADAVSAAMPGEG